MMKRCLVHNIPARWLSAAAIIAGFSSLMGLTATDPLAELRIGVASLDNRQFGTAIRELEPLAKRLPKLADYCAWFLASAEFGAKNYEGAIKALDPIWEQAPSSPLSAKAYMLAADAYVQSGSGKQAVEILRKNYASLPQPKGDLALASAFVAAGDGVSGAVYYQRVYYGFPLLVEAGQAGTELSSLKAALGDTYPAASASSMLARAVKLIDGGQVQKARKELETLIPQLGGVDRDLARVRIGVADYTAKENAPASHYLKSLEKLSPEADSERLYYLLLCARRLNNESEASEAMARLGHLYPTSKWRLQALISSANRLLADNQFDAYEPLYRECYESFSQEPEAGFCHWKVAWGHYLRRKPDAEELLIEHIRRFPASEDASAALYFLGRLTEGSHDAGSAFAYYTEVAREYPNQYYASQARQRLALLGPGVPSQSATEFLKSVAFPKRMRVENFKASASAAARIERAKMLESAGLDGLAQDELRFGAQMEDQPHLMAMELASLYSPTHPDQALRYIKHYASGYLYLPLDSAPLQFWTLAFPLPYRSDLERYAKQNELDPFVVAALIRQESEFDAKVISYADARGLTQIMPSTGRELSRRLKLTSYSTAKLFQPSINLQLGTYYLESLTKQTGGRLEVALAAYNAGLSRARAWLQWGDFQEPAEFIETVPFAQTRNYIQAVLRNADVYRHIYSVPDQLASASRNETNGK